ncbi:MAG: hypothetical protein Q4P78_07205 [Rothia sp. (in: high G+C Gram-positive bacteria)]|uniref:hypothetical protein n=1 Tax=Rothia sp. (in: high G+C Gram-positive bacteria) TaxID=1885016 RepID=UPI0026DF3D86|nr:hypothetical protein [Rothia sp. (in: high G+C Gram-positive bacteria)]MDO5750970.1 hypothetical protein [Rothia sp. (in: high G+C Gram-positive bacteria)]
MHRKFLKIKYALSIVCALLLCVSLTGCSKSGKSIPSESPSSYTPEIDIQPAAHPNPQAQQIMNSMMQYPEEMTDLIQQALTLCMKSSGADYVSKTPVHLPVRSHYTLLDVPEMRTPDYSQDTRFQVGYLQRYGLHFSELYAYGYTQEQASAYHWALYGDMDHPVIGSTGQSLGTESSCMVQVSRYIFGDPSTLFYYALGTGYAGTSYISSVRSDKDFKALDRELMACVDNRAGISFKRDILEGYAYVYPGAQEVPDPSIARVELDCRQELNWEQKISSLLDAYITAFLENPKYEREREAYKKAHEYALEHYEERKAQLADYRWM